MFLGLNKNMDPIQENDIKNERILSDTLIVSWLSILSYLASFLYQNGYFSYFGVPNYLIEINFSQIFTTLISVCFFVYLIFTLVHILYLIGLFDRSTAVNRSRAITSILSLFLLVEAFLFYNVDKKVVWICLIMVGAQILVEYLVPFFVHRKKGSMEEKLQEQEKIEKIEKNLFKKLFNQIGKQMTSFLMISLLVLILSYQLGYVTAARQHNFITIKNNVDIKSIVIQPYKESFITLEIDDQGKLNGNINLVNLETYSSKGSIQKFTKITPSNVKCGMKETDFFYRNC